MFFISFPVSEIVCFLSMILTSMYLLIGTLGNMQQKQIVTLKPEKVIIKQYIPVIHQKCFQIIPDRSENIKSHQFCYFKNIRPEKRMIKIFCYLQAIFVSNSLSENDFSKISGKRGPPLS